MRLPRPAAFAGVAVMATTMAVLPLTSASAAFDDGDYSLTEACAIDATLKVRGGGNGLSVTASTSMALVKSDDGAIVIEFGDAATADDNVVHTLSPADDGIACVTDIATDDEIAVLLGLEATTTADAYAAEISVEESSDDEADDVDASEESAGEDSVEDAEKVTICHNVENNPHDINVSASSVDAHLDHGDLEGECPDDLASKKATKAERDEDKADRKAAKDEDKADRKAARDKGKAEKADKANDEDDS